MIIPLFNLVVAFCLIAGWIAYRAYMSAPEHILGSLLVGANLAWAFVGLSQHLPT